MYDSRMMNLSGASPTPPVSRFRGIARRWGGPRIAAVTILSLAAIGLGVLRYVATDARFSDGAERVLQAMAFGTIALAPAVLAALSTRRRAILLVPAALVLIPLSVLSMAGVLFPLLVPAALLWIALVTRWDGVPCGTTRAVVATMAVLVLLVAAIAVLFAHQDPRSYGNWIGGDTGGMSWGSGSTGPGGSGGRISDVITSHEALASIGLVLLALLAGWLLAAPRTAPVDGTGLPRDLDTPDRAADPLSPNQGPPGEAVPMRRKGGHTATAVRSLNSLPLPMRWALFGSIAFALVGGLIGLVVGLLAHPATAWFAVLEIGLPAAFLGMWVGLMYGGIAFLYHHDARSQAALHSSGPRWPDAVITLAAIAVISALRWMDWASKVDSLERSTFKDGPTHLLAITALASLALSLAIAVARWRWLRLLLLAAALLTAGAAVAVALSSVYAANTSNLQLSLGPAETSYEPGAAVGVLAGLVMVAAATVGLLASYTTPAEDMPERWAPPAGLTQ
jgi:hypothetical protein